MFDSYSQYRRVLKQHYTAFNESGIALGFTLVEGELLARAEYPNLDYPTYLSKHEDISWSRVVSVYRQASAAIKAGLSLTQAYKVGGYALGKMFKQPTRAEDILIAVRSGKTARQIDILLSGGDDATPIGVHLQAIVSETTQKRFEQFVAKNKGCTHGEAIRLLLNIADGRTQLIKTTGRKFR